MKASDSEVRRAFLGLTGGQPCMLEALCRRGSPLWVIIQHTTKKVWESRSSLKQEVVFLHQNIVKAPEPEWTDTEKITCNTRTGLSCDKKTKQRRLNGLETHLCGWNNLQNIYQRRQQLEGFYPATPQSERCGLQGGMQRVSSGSSVIRSALQYTHLPPGRRLRRFWAGTGSLRWPARRPGRRQRNVQNLRRENFELEPESSNSVITAL